MKSCQGAISMPGKRVQMLLMWKVWTLGIPMFKETTSETPDKERKQSKPPRKASKKSRSGDTKQSSFHHIECEDDAYSSTKEYSDQQYDCVEYSHINIDTGGLNTDTCKMEKDVFATIELQNRSDTKCTLRIKVYTVAQGNNLHLRIYKKMYPDDLDHEGRPVNVYPVLSTTQLTMYNKTTIQCLGYVIFTCKYKNSNWCESKASGLSLAKL